ncbi:hypothetical protein BJV74DRAFT_916664 [Russula compacta]|nr:hypothetical protein BJV74DRAFT_916664 [Russula compacta]
MTIDFGQKDPRGEVPVARPLADCLRALETSALKTALPTCPFQLLILPPHLRHQARRGSARARAFLAATEHAKDPDAQSCHRRTIGWVKVKTPVGAAHTSSTHTFYFLTNMYYTHYQTGRTHSPRALWLLGQWFLRCDRGAVHGATSGDTRGLMSCVQGSGVCGALDASHKVLFHEYNGKRSTGWGGPIWKTYGTQLAGSPVR